MKGSYLLGHSAAKRPKANIFAKRSSLILHDLLVEQEEPFRIRGLSEKTGLSVGLVHRVLSELAHDGFVRVEGIRTAKDYRVERRAELMELWLSSYRIADRCRLHTYNTAYSEKEILKALTSSPLAESAVLALHSSCRQFGYSYTNLETTELYLRDKDKREEFERLLYLEPQERGYQVLLIEPYYSEIIERRMSRSKNLLVSPPFLSFLDLYHFPLRGQEQAEYLLGKHPALRILAAAMKKDNRGRKNPR